MTYVGTQQIGGLLATWWFYLFFMEMQGGLKAGTYKRVHTWMVNLPLAVAAVCGLIVTSKAKSDRVATETSGNVTMGMCAAALVLPLVNTTVYALRPRYKHFAWLRFAAGDVPAQKGAAAPRTAGALPASIFCGAVALWLIGHGVVLMVMHGATVSAFRRLTDAYVHARCVGWRGARPVMCGD